MRAQVCSAAGEAAMARGRYEQAQSEYEEALHLAYEVGAHAEAPFLIARLGEIAYRSGDTPLAEGALAEADAEADRYGAVDARAFVRALSSTIALGEGDAVRAREECEAARDQGERTTPPPQFDAAIAHPDGRVTAAESTPRAGLPLLAEGLRRAVPARCAELVLATLTESVAVLLLAPDDPARAARLHWAATARRSGRPRSQPERAEADSVEDGLRTALGEQRYARERTAGAALTAKDVLGEVSAGERELGIAWP
ncbi:hypothetical protein QIS99_21565 [Streptomyces sp. B-S-A8]|uniref:Tetratricopeptide repeat protein n=1 Tax=Streptomyces solicavernae TaxID=3043614 RepID=A0ABT6RWD7_9ACTN|nr:hypothetical protein [Streptomyces sp. B-S-A8]MDI3388758.1 hypothetical protein [Streptomyces sp. B-S-A8]